MEYSTKSGFITKKDTVIKDTNYSYLIDRYIKDLGLNTLLPGMLNTKRTQYFLASRVIQCMPGGNQYGIRVYSQTDIMSHGLFADFVSNQERWGYVRPIVSIESNAIISLDTQNTTDEVTYWNIQF